MFLAISSAFGLPAHPLVVHAAVVLVPVAAVGFAATAWRPAWRRSYGIPVLTLAFAGALFAFLADQSGGPLEHNVRDAARAAGTRARFGDHPEQGQAAYLWAVFFLVAVGVVFVADRWGERLRLPKWAPGGLYAVALLPALVAVLTMVAAGHSGAQLVWKDVGSFAAGR